MSRVRLAVEDDVTELVRLRALLFQTLGGDFFNPSSAGEGWRDSLAAVLKEQVTAENMRILVVDGEDGLAACGAGTIEQWLPGPHVRNGRIGHVMGMVTDPAYRRRGHGRAIMQGLLDWFRERGVPGSTARLPRGRTALPSTGLRRPPRSLALLASVTKPAQPYKTVRIVSVRPASPQRDGPPATGDAEGPPREEATPA
jgi:GNAT superfamily N-acetyltransferase